MRYGRHKKGGKASFNTLKILFLFSIPKPPSMKVVIVPLGYARRTLMFNISTFVTSKSRR
jgi:hypothetical protein